MIAKFCETQKVATGNCVRIDFKKRNPMFGFLVQAGDYEDLKSKNFWRIVSETHIDNWKTSHDNNLAKIFNGAEITRLTPVVVK